MTPDVIKLVGPIGFENPSSLTVGAFFAGYGCGTGGFQLPTCVFEDGLELGPMLFTTVPEPGTGLLIMAGLLGLAGRRRPA